MAPLFGEDLEVEALAPLLDALPVESAESASGWGWQYYTYDLTKAQLATGPDRQAWSPVELDANQFVVVNRLCQEDVDAEDPAFREFLAQEGLEVDTFVRGLIGTSLVARNGTKLTLTTVNCTCLLLPDGRRIAADNNTGRLERWVDRFMNERRECSATSDGEKT